jgi:hypothetical protein
MAYNAHPTVITGQIWAASDQNVYVAGNFQTLFVYTTKGDIAVCKDSDELVRVAIGTDGTLWIADSAQTAGVRAGQLPIELPLVSAIFPISGVTGAGLSQHESSASSPKPNQHRASFVSTSDTWLMWKKVLPSLMGSAPVLRVHGYMDTATSGVIGFGVQVAAMTDGDLSIDAKAFGTTNLGSETVPANSKTKFVLDIALTNLDSWAKDDEVIIGLYRNTAVGSNASGICYVTHAQIIYG